MVPDLAAWHAQCGMKHCCWCCCTRPALQEVMGQMHTSIALMWQPQGRPGVWSSLACCLGVWNQCCTQSLMQDDNCSSMTHLFTGMVGTTSGQWSSSVQSCAAPECLKLLLYADPEPNDARGVQGSWAHE